MQTPRLVWLIITLLALFSTKRPVQADVMTDWDHALLKSIRVDNSPPTLASRNLAILHTAIYDAVNSIERTHQPYHFLVSPNGEASIEAAVVGAGHAVLVNLYPQLRASFDEHYQRFVSSARADASLTNGLQLGSLIGKLTVDSRSCDGSTTQTAYIPNEAPGKWRRTPPFFRPPLDPHWRCVQLFCLPEKEPFLPSGPPALDSAAYANDLQQVRTMGGKRSVERTAEQSQIATFWSDFSYTVMPPGHWQQIAATIAQNRGSTIAEKARLFALVSLAQADAGIIVWEAKYRDNFWRPVTAIHRADEDGNPATEKDESWESFLVTPPFPEYTSGHSTFSKASAVVIANFFGTDTLSFTVGSDALPGISRTFQSLSACADEVGLSRIYGGIHFPSANLDGKACGERVGQYVSRHFLLPNDRLASVAPGNVKPAQCQLRASGHNSVNCNVKASRELATLSFNSTF